MIHLRKSETSLTKNDSAEDEESQQAADEVEYDEA